MQKHITTGTEHHRELLDQLQEQVETLRTTEGWQRWLRFAAAFHEYSLNNQLLILMQRPNATRVAGYKAWQSLGRQVNKGERGIRILAPRTRSVEDEDGERTSVLTGFRVVRVFDVSQTSGEPLLTVTLPDVTGSNKAIFQSLLDAAAAEELEVIIEQQPEDWDEARGWFNHEERRITLVDFGQGVDNMSRTLLHELGHYCDPATRAEDKEHLRPALEVIAESAAMIVGTSVFGLNMTDASATYVATWMEALDLFEPDFMAQLADHTLRVTRRLEDVLRPQQQL